MVFFSDGNLYAVGGYDSSSHLATVEKYEPQVSGNKQCTGQIGRTEEFWAPLQWSPVAQGRQWQQEHEALGIGTGKQTSEPQVADSPKGFLAPSCVIVTPLRIDATIVWDCI